MYDPRKAGVYMESLKKEISLISSKVLLSTLYIGGGTPTALPDTTLSNLLSYLFNFFSFHDNYEATIEANPGTVDNAKLCAIRSSGINRISIGVQSFNNNELAYLGRIHTSDQAEQAVHHARDTGFDSIGIDLIYGIPGQDIDSWKRTLEKAVSLKPQHISTYELTLEKGTLLYKFLKNSPSPHSAKGGTSDEEVIEMYDHTIDYLKSEGYAHYEISNYALPGYECRHNLNYWDRGEYYGAGLGAHSFIDGKRSYNTDDPDEYLKRISENKVPVKKTEIITEDMALAEAIFLGLRKTEGLNVEAFSRRYKKNILSFYHKEIKALKEARLIEITESPSSYETKVRLTRKGIILSNEVFEKFI
jgi:oxygen-independent coproporphyrinogen-3 oxidase